MGRKRRKTRGSRLGFQVEVEPAKAETFDILMTQCGTHTRHELFNNAASLLEWAVEEVRQGRRIGSVVVKGAEHQFYAMQTDKVPALERAAKNAAR